MPTIPYKSKDGARLPGVTTVIDANLGWNKRQLMRWAWREGTEGRDYLESSARAADAGTIAHYLIECDLTGVTPDLSAYPEDLIAPARQSFKNYLSWKKVVRFKPIAVEPHLVSEVYGYGMTPDCIARINGKTSLFDWKTSGGLYPNMLIQLAAYEQGWNENNARRRINGGAYLLRIDKTTAAFHFHHWADLGLAWEAFAHLLDLHKLKTRIEKMT